MTHRTITAEEARALRGHNEADARGRAEGSDFAARCMICDLAATIEALHAEAGRLRALVADAYSEGYKRADLDVGWGGAQRIAECWADSEARAALDTVAPNDLMITLAELRETGVLEINDFNHRLWGRLGRRLADDEPFAFTILAEVMPNGGYLVWALCGCRNRDDRALAVEVARLAAQRVLASARPASVPMIQATLDAARACLAGELSPVECSIAADACYALARETKSGKGARKASYVAYAAAHAAYGAADTSMVQSHAIDSCDYAAAAAENDRAEYEAQRKDLLVLLALRANHAKAASLEAAP